MELVERALAELEGRECLAALMECAVGEAVIAKFAEAGEMPVAKMKAEVQGYAPLGAYFIKVVRQVVAELKEEAEAA